MPVSKSEFGKTSDGVIIEQYVLKSDKLEVGVLNYGGTITYLKTLDRNGKFDDVVTGFNTFQDYTDKSQFFGCIVGRVANRIANGKFKIDGKEYKIVVNNGPNSLHGGTIGFDKKIWDVEVEVNSITLRYTSNDGEEGFPGELSAFVTYAIVENQLSIEYKANSTKPTPINLTNHSYFNLSGHENWEKDLSNHKITLFASEFLPADDNCLVTGEIKPVEGSIFDLRAGQLLLPQRLHSVPGGGYDHNFCLSLDKNIHQVATVEHGPSGRVMKVQTTAPGVQFYTGNFLKGNIGKNDVCYSKHSALCLETQNWPDAINHPENFPSCILRPTEVYHHKTIFTFETN